jgi:membrane protein implicated in regulation of membrane protease activity
MGPRNWIGLAILLIGVALQPIGWMYYYWIQILSFVLIFIGVNILITQKYLDKSVEREFTSGKRSGHALPGDVHNNSGCGQGGRSESWTSEHYGGSESSGD